MRKLVLLLLISCYSGLTFAQQDAFAKKLLDQVSKKYDGYKTVQADFSFQVNQIDAENYSDAGVMYMNKPLKQYKIVLKDQELISDGKSVWSILKEEKEVQVTDADNSTSSIGPNNIFTFYKTGFKYVSMDDERLKGEVLQVIELSPIDTKKNYFKIKLRINQNKHIHDVLIFDKSGAKYTYTINSLFVNHKLDPSTFKFEKSKYPSFEVVDLR